VQNRLIILLPQAWVEFRDRGLAHAEMGQTGEALQDLQTYLDHAAQSVDSVAITLRVAELKRATN
jgi:regulator of sirC expression with transglutaminase-like and TPR domain